MAANHAQVLESPSHVRLVSAKDIGTSGAASVINYMGMSPCLLYPVGYQCFPTLNGSPDHGKTHGRARQSLLLYRDWNEHYPGTTPKFGRVYAHKDFSVLKSESHCSCWTQKTARRSSCLIRRAAWVVLANRVSDVGKERWMHVPHLLWALPSENRVSMDPESLQQPFLRPATLLKKC